MANKAPSYLNIDEVVDEKRVLTLNGVDYDMHHMTVEEFIEFTKRTQNVDFDELAVHERIENLVDQVKMAFKDVPDEVLRGLSIEKLGLIVKFAAGSMAEGAETTVAKGAGSRRGKN